MNNPQNALSRNRADVLDRVKRGLIRYSTFERTIEAIRQYGNIIIVMGAEEISPVAGSSQAGETVRRRFTDVWQNEEGTWRMIVRHPNLIPSE